MPAFPKPIFLAAVSLAVASPATAATVQGQLSCSGGQARATSIAVTLIAEGADATQRTKPFFTGADGMYYLQGIAPGQYTLEIWLSRSSSTPSLTFPVKVKEPSTILDTHTLDQCSAQ